jgi:vacuolar-type H+-ATPase subunit H
MEITMAGEVLRSIKKTEEKAQKIIVDARSEAKRVAEDSDDKRKQYIVEKDRLLKKQEEEIKKRYADETIKEIEALTLQEERHIENVDERCKKTLTKVVSYISEEIIKE